jgi:hypothetical protein
VLALPLQRGDFWEMQLDAENPDVSGGHCSPR